ncbi:hypothetical protein FEAC_03990 [Ferrimicrobium acidiphilum DSM 19497]|uniref:Uncharacterized protein n=1 Tax=Ferrimicrobium acidiphilum DSM 19497 TaxID=1121877 RepID=A0A0D8FWW2_9ACTN|nr:hypothetical protein FEAC_03990 [Ferrimicrobium acidiphilum DSM 19497]
MGWQRGRPYTLEVVEKVVTLRASRTFWTGMVLYKHHTNGWA